MRPILRATLLLALLAGCHGLPAPPTGAGDLEAKYRRAAQLRGAALAAMDGERWDEAIAALEELERTLPRNLLAPLDLAIAHQQAGDTRAAADAAQRAATIDADNPRLHYALAQLERAGGSDWPSRLDQFTVAHPRDPRPHHLATRWHTEDGASGAAWEAAESAVRADPENLVLLVDRLVAAAAADRPEVADALDAIEDRLEGFPLDVQRWADELREKLDAGGAPALVTPQAQVVRNVLRPTELYRQHLIPLVGRGEIDRGYFVQYDFEPPLPKSIQGGSDIDIAFERMAAARLPIDGPVLVAGAAAGDQLVAQVAGDAARLHWQEGAWQIGSDPDVAADRLWSLLDYDQDGTADLVFSRGRQVLLSTTAGGDATVVAELAGTPLTVEPADLDHDGDLDLVVADRDHTRYQRNNGDGSWQEDPALSAAFDGPITDLAVADFDDDGDLDAVAAGAAGLRFLDNARLGVVRGIDGVLPAGDGSFTHLELADFDNDGWFDLLAWGGSQATLLTWRDGRFAPSPLDGGGWRSAAVADFDNDGDRDVVVATAEGATLLRNRDGSLVAEALDPALSAADSLAAGDWDGDGDLDLAAFGPAGFASWRNDGGNLNHWLRLTLRGKTENNAKNHSQGFASKIETRVGAGYQAVLASGAVNHLGLGAARQVDVLRVLWTNGLAQSWAGLAADQTLHEEQVLKGSCPFLYTWNGRRFEFVTDLMWKSPLGMTLADGSAAPHQSAADFVRVPPDSLSAIDGEYWLQVTEELWETVYVDRQELWVFDTPEGVEMVVDERFTPPPHPEYPETHWIGDSVAPTTAVDHAGRDVASKVAERDGRHVGDLPLGRYQGVTDSHTLTLAWDRLPTAGEPRLLLWGWIFPTDTSINVALSQRQRSRSVPSTLEVRSGGGDWQPVAGGLPMPAGKNKALVIDLSGHDLRPPIEARLTTSLQIYWDAAALGGTVERAPVLRRLAPITADLHPRGYSRLYRVDDAGPHLFDYDRVTAAPRFRDLTGLYTRFGSVTELVTATDDLYVVMNAGDELTLRYDARSLPPLPIGWRRDFVLYTDGWVKDGDLNTTASQTVEPLPHHSMSAYPAAGDPGPDRPGWSQRYQTRRVDDRRFAEALRERPSGR